MSMNAIKKIQIGCLLLLGCVACNEATPDAFQEINGIYFNNRGTGNMVINSTYTTFVYVNENVLDIPVRIQTLGRPSTENRPIAIRVAGGNAEEGKDYELKTPAEIPAGAVTLDYIVELKRTDALKEGNKELVLELQANDHFILPFDYQVQSGNDTVPVNTFRILFTDRFTVEPEAWDINFGGVFSQQKFELMCDILDLDRASFNQANGISLSRWYYIATRMRAYVAEETAKKEAGEAYDERAFDPVSGNPFEFQKPENN